MYDKVVTGVHVGRLEAAFEVFVGVETECHVELFAFVDRFLAWGERYGEGVVAIGALDVDGNVAREVVLLPVDVHENLADADAACFFRGFQLKGVDASLVTAPVAASAKEGIEHVLDIGANHLVGTVDADQGKSVCGLDLQFAAVFGEFVQGKYKLESKVLARFHAFAVHLQGRPCLCAQGGG